MTEEFDAKRRDILEGASEVFVRRGFAAGTTKEIAAEVGLSQPAIYHYVGSKAGLLREIALHVGRDMVAALDAGMASSADPAEQLRAVIHEFTAAVARDRRSFAVFWQEQHSLEAEVAEKLAADERDFVNKVGGLIKALQKRGTMPEGPPLLMARAILSMPSWMYHWYQPSGRLKTSDIADIYCRLIGLET
jgi:TetR/AcrR family transcriptional regulator, cholesterol catabolism regulator